MPRKGIGVLSRISSLLGTCCTGRSLVQSRIPDVSSLRIQVTEESQFSLREDIYEIPPQNLSLLRE